MPHTAQHPQSVALQPPPEVGNRSKPHGIARRGRGFWGFRVSFGVSGLLGFTWGLMSTYNSNDKATYNLLRELGGLISTVLFGVTSTLSLQVGFGV